MDWKKIDDDYSRAKVLRGWIVRHDKTNQMVFVPDQLHQWQV